MLGSAVNIVVIFSLVFCSQYVMADKWRYKAGSTSQKYLEGSIECEVIQTVLTESTNNYPTWQTVCRDQNISLFQVPYGASTIQISKNGEYIVGLSNEGLQAFAFWVADKSGKILLARKHYTENVDFNYCKKSKSIEAQWYKEKSIVEIQIVEKRLTDILVEGCDDSKISLFHISTEGILTPKEIDKKQSAGWLQKMKKYISNFF